MFLQPLEYIQSPFTPCPFNRISRICNIVKFLKDELRYNYFSFYKTCFSDVRYPSVYYNACIQEKRNFGGFLRCVFSIRGRNKLPVELIALFTLMTEKKLAKIGVLTNENDDGKRTVNIQVKTRSVGNRQGWILNKNIEAIVSGKNFYIKHYSI